MKSERINRSAEVKITADRGETWSRRRINFANELDESGLRPGEIFEYLGEQYEVMMGDEGLRIKKLEERIGKTKSVNCFANK